MKEALGRVEIIASGFFCHVERSYVVASTKEQIKSRDQGEKHNGTYALLNVIISFCYD